MRKCCETFVESNNNVKKDDFDDISDAGIDFFFGDDRTDVKRDDDDDDVSSVGEDLDGDVFDEEQNDESFYVDEIDSRVESFEAELKDDLLVTQSLGPQLSEAFDLVRMIDFEGPWMSNVDRSSSVEKNSDVVEVSSFEDHDEEEQRFEFTDCCTIAVLCSSMILNDCESIVVLLLNETQCMQLF